MKKGKVYMSMETVNGTYGSEEQKIEEMTRYLNGLKRYTEKGIPIYMDGKLSGQREWEKLFEVREDGMFYMGDYVQAEGGGLKEIRFDKVYLYMRRGVVVVPRKCRTALRCTAVPLAAPVCPPPYPKGGGR